MSVCKSCGATVQAGSTFCPSCGQDVLSNGNAVICLQCNTPNPAGTRFCKGCGAVLIKKSKSVQCAVCGSENAPDAIYCTVCGSEMPGEVEIELESESVKQLKNLIPEIETYAQAVGELFPGVDEAELSAMTYICPVCGKLNSVSDGKCKRCGRDKKRTAELAAKGRVPNFDSAVLVPDKKVKPPKVVLDNAQTAPKHEFKNGKPSAAVSPMFGYGGYGGGYGQMSPIVQPIAIVPYVTQEQPLWQTASKEEIAAAEAAADTSGR
ncbi:MAG: zinc ribbon domain-containing protein [Clostridia bacterium]